MIKFASVLFAQYHFNVGSIEICLIIDAACCLIVKSG